MIKGYEFDVEDATTKCIKWIKEYFKNNGPDCNAIIGISGGKDSSVAAALCVKALGRSRVFGVLMPNGEQHDIDMAVKLCNCLGIDYITVDISGAIKSIRDQVKTALHGHWSLQTSTNIPARIRMTTLYAVAQTLNGRVVNTCNLSEDMVGYSTRYGDSVGDFAPLAYFTVSEVKEIGKYLGLPDELVDKVPEDGLSGKTDEDNLGFTYDVLDEYIRTGLFPSLPLETKKRIDCLHDKNLFKLKEMPKFYYTPYDTLDDFLEPWS